MTQLCLFLLDGLHWMKHVLRSCWNVPRTPILLLLSSNGYVTAHYFLTAPVTYHSPRLYSKVKRWPLARWPFEILCQKIPVISNALLFQAVVPEVQYLTPRFLVSRTGFSVLYLGPFLSRYAILCYHHLNWNFPHKWSRVYKLLSYGNFSVYGTRLKLILMKPETRGIKRTSICLCYFEWYVKPFWNSCTYLLFPLRFK